MGDQWWETVANEFVNHYYTQFDSSPEARASLAGLYQNESMLTFNGEPIQGPAAIQEKLTSLTFKSVTHQPSSILSQPAPNGGVIVSVSGMLQTDDDPAHPFSQVFHLLPAEGSYYVFNDIFSLILFG